MELVIWVAFLIFALIIIAFTLYAYAQSAYLAIFLFLLGGGILLIAGLSGMEGFEIESAKNVSTNSTYQPINSTEYNSTGAITAIQTTFVANNTQQTSTTDWKTVTNEYTRGINLAMILFGIAWMLFGFVNLLRQKGHGEIH